MVNEITLQIGDKTYVDFQSFTLYRDIEALSGRFVVSASPPDDLDNFITDIRDPNSAVILRIDNEPIITGYIDYFDISYNDSSHEIVFGGRDKTSDFMDSTLDSKTFNPPIGFVELLQHLLKIVGYQVVTNQKQIGFGQPDLNQISIINNAGIIESFSTAEGIQLNHSETAFGLIQKMAEKRHLILNSDGNGNIVIARVGDERAETILQNIKSQGPTNLGLSGTGVNNIKSAKIKSDFTERFNKYTIKSMLNKNNGGPLVGALSSTTSNIGVTQTGVTYDPTVRPTRKFTALASSSMTSADCKNRATWQANIARTKGFTYCCEVFGFRQNLKEIFGNPTLFPLNPLWKPNQLVYVNDEFANIDDDMLIKSVTYKQDLNKGSVTELELVDKLSFSLSLFEPALRRKANKDGPKTLIGVLNQ